MYLKLKIINKIDLLVRLFFIILIMILIFTFEIIKSCFFFIINNDSFFVVTSVKIDYDIKKKRTVYKNKYICINQRKTAFKIK